MILITRPIDESIKTQKKLEALGYKSIVLPFLKINKLSHIKQDWAESLVVTSKNALHAVLMYDKDILIYSVGDATSKVLRNLGYHNLVTGENSARSLSKLINKKSLYLCGDHISYKFDNVIECVCYESVKNNDISDAIDMNSISVVLIYSKRTAEVFADNFKDNLNIKTICLSQNIAASLYNFKNVLYTTTHTEDDMIKLI